MERTELAILFSGGTDSLALYALAAAGRHAGLPRPRHIHLLHMRNGMERFADFPRQRFEIAQGILEKQLPAPDSLVEATMVELDMGRLFQGLWLDRYEEIMPRYGGKNLVCVACKVGMHTRSVLYGVEHLVPVVAAGYTSKQRHYPEQTTVFMEKIAAFSLGFGITTIFPVYEDFDDVNVTRQVLEDFGLPSTGGGERKCLFCQTLTTATESEIGNYLDDMLPQVTRYVEYKLAGRSQEAALVFPPGR